MAMTTKITSQQLHICASVLLDAQGRGAGGRFEGGEQALLQGVHFLSELASKPDTVAVPREMLRKVLIVAMADSRIAEWHSKVVTDWEGQRARIAKLQRAAGMEEDHG